MKLQACTKCGAQFDVAAFSVGQQFTCGACGEVLTAHGAGGPPAARTPGAARTRSRTPGAARGAGPAPTRPPAARRDVTKAPGGPKRAVTGGPAAQGRGPQYQPVQRAGQAAARGTPAARPGAAGRAPATARRGGGRRARGGDGEEEEGRAVRRSAGGPNKAILIGAGGVVLLVVILLIAMGGSKKDTGGSGTDVAGGGSGGSGTQVQEPEAPTETIKDVMGDYVTERPTMLRDYKKFIHRLQALDPAETKGALTTVYENFIEGPGRDDKEAREFLGYKEFPYEIPEDIAFRKYPYLDAVTVAFNKHWFGPDEKEEYEIAMQAWKQTEEHRDKLINDHRFLAADSIRSLIAHDKYFKDYYYAARWADPYLICYSSKDRLSEYDLLQIEDKDERRLKLKEIAKTKKEFETVLDEKAAIFQQLYKEFMRRYQEKLNLKPLMDPYGGREDYKLGVRSFEYGCPMVVWIFNNKQSFNEYHSKVKQELIPHNVAGYFSPQTGFVYLYDEGDNPGNRVFEINKNVHEGTHQLEFWFTRQRNRWAKPIPGQDFFGEGIAEFIGSVQMQPDRTLKFIGVNVPRLQGMHMAKTMFERQGNTYKLFPVAKLVSFTSYGDVQAWGQSNWGIDPGNVLGMFYQQSWAFVYFLNNYKAGKYKESFEKFFDLVLHRETGFSEGDKAFREAFRIRDEDDWEDINDEFHEYITDELMKLNTSKWDYTPPKRGEASGD